MGEQKMKFETKRKPACKKSRTQSGDARAVAAAWLLLGLIFLLAFLLPGRPREDAPGPADTLPPAPVDDAAVVRVLVGEDVVSMPMSQYLWRVVAAEMPASFELEALKAQAVAARTYAAAKMGQVVANHPDADVCGDITCCQAYITEEDAARNWGTAAETYRRKIARAVAETDGLLCLYDGAPIQALFHSSTAGRTVNAVEVWGNEVPYLTGVESPEGEEVPNWHSTVTLTAGEVREKLLAAWPEADLSGPAEGWLAVTSYDSAGGIDGLLVGGVEAGGQALRTALGLRSTHVEWTVEGERWTFTATGYGHGVGMSQYGANALAKQGKTFEEILKWYYTGVEVAQLPGTE